MDRQKIIHCSNPQGLTWGAMNNSNYETLRRRARLGQLVRNQHVRHFEELGWPFEFVDPAGWPEMVL